MEDELKVKPKRQPMPASQLSFRKYPKLKADEFIRIVNGSFGACSHPLSPFDFVLQKNARKEPKMWKCEYLKAYIDKNIDFN